MVREESLVSRLSNPRDFYDAVAATYAEILPDTRAETPFDLGILDHFINEMPESANPVLDAGCGSGRMIRYLASRGIENASGVDLSENMIAQARLNNPGTPLAVADIRALPFAPASVRSILCWYAIIHSSVDEVRDIVAEFSRVLEPSGLALFSFQSGSGERLIERGYGHDVSIHGVLHRTETIAALLTNAGFEIVATAERQPTAHERSCQGFVLARKL